jgi:hypothetical protein
MSDTEDNKIYELPDYIVELLLSITQYGVYDSDMCILAEFLNCYFKRDKEAMNLFSLNNDYLDFNELEKVCLGLKDDFNNHLLKFMVEKIRKINEDNLIEKKKIEYRDKGIKLRTFQRSNINITSLIGKIHINRMTLRGVTAEDREKLSTLEGKASVVPMDDYLGISKLPFKITVGAMLEIADWVQRSNSYESAQQGLKKYTKINVNDDTIRYVANYIGKIVFENELLNADKVYNNFVNCNLNLPKEKIDGQLYIEADGAMFHTREKDDNGYTWRENKLGIVFNSKDLIKWQSKQLNEKNEYEFIKMKKIGCRDYTAYIGSYEIFQKLLFACALKNGYGKYNTTIMITDGAKWLKTVKDHFFCDAVHILDFYHLSENVHKFAKQLYNNNEKDAKDWADDICMRLKASETQSVLNQLSKIDGRKIRKCSFNLQRYIFDNINNIDYAHYLSNDWFIGSGAIESSNKSVLQWRLKQAGMRWNIETAQYIIALMTKAKSNRWHTDVVLKTLDHFGIPYTI